MISEGAVSERIAQVVSLREHIQGNTRYEIEMRQFDGYYTLYLLDKELQRSASLPGGIIISIAEADANDIDIQKLCTKHQLNYRKSG